MIDNPLTETTKRFREASDALARFEASYLNASRAVSAFKDRLAILEAGRDSALENMLLAAEQWCDEADCE